MSPGCSPPYIIRHLQREREEAGVSVDGKRLCLTGMIQGGNRAIPDAVVYESERAPAEMMTARPLPGSCTELRLCRRVFEMDEWCSAPLRCKPRVEWAQGRPIEVMQVSVQGSRGRLELHHRLVCDNALIDVLDCVQRDKAFDLK